MEQTEQERGELSAAVGGALAERSSPSPLDAGTAQLAEHYAQLIDNAAPSRSYATALRVIDGFIAENSSILRPDRERELVTAWDKVSSALAEHSVASDLGPKLLAALHHLGLTTAARSKGRGAQERPEQNTEQEHAPAAVLQLLQGNADGRYGRAG